MARRLGLVGAVAPDAVSLATDELAAGRMVLLRDDTERAGEGDLLIAAEFADAEAINFMVTEARGLVCLALSTERCAELGLEQIGNRGNQSSLGDSAMVSIDICPSESVARMFARTWCTRSSRAGRSSSRRFAYASR